MLAFLLLPVASAVLAQVRVRLGALPALWRLETDVSELEHYLSHPEAFVQIAGPDCACIGKQGCDCEDAASAKKDVAALAKMRGEVEHMDLHDMPKMMALLKSMYSRFETNIQDAAKLEADASVTFQKKEATMTKEQKVAAEQERSKNMKRFETTLAVAKQGMEQLKGGLKSLTAGKTSFVQVRQSLLTYCKGALQTIRAAKKGPDCACIGKTEGPDCACIGKEEKHALVAAEKGPDCACIGKTEGPDCACIGKEQKPVSFVQLKKREDPAPAPEDQLAKEMTHDLEMNFNKIAPFGKEDTAKELQDHAADTQDTLVDAVENAEVARSSARSSVRSRASARRRSRSSTRSPASRRRPSMRTTMRTTTAPRTRSATCTRTRPQWRRTSSSLSTRGASTVSRLCCCEATHRRSSV
jgi:hypothetical protein